MTTGRITADAEAVLSLSVRNPGEANREARFEAVIDTGFNGALTLPAGKIERLGLPEAGEDQVVLGDGRVVTMPTFEALVRFGETTHRFSVEQAPTEPLVGTELLWGYGLRVDFEPGGRVEMEALP